MKYIAIIDGKSIEIELNWLTPSTIDAQIDGRKYVAEATTVEPGLYWFNWNNRSIEIAVVPYGDGYTVSLEDRSVEVEIVDSRRALKKAAQQGNTGAIE